MGNRKDLFNTINISETLGYMLVLPPSTASRTAIQVFNYFPFATYFVSDNKVIYSCDGATHGHTHMLFEGHENYKLIMTCKNPYSKWVSRYRLHMINKPTIKSNFDIQNSFFEHVLDQIYAWNIGYNLSQTELKFSSIKKEVSHFIRTENILEDYRNIPFIGGSDFDKSGKLEEVLNKPLGKFPKETMKICNFFDDWRDYYTSESADLVYNLFKQDFEFYGYGRDSWKK